MSFTHMHPFPNVRVFFLVIGKWWQLLCSMILVPLLLSYLHHKLWTLEHNFLCALYCVFLKFYFSLPNLLFTSSEVAKAVARIIALALDLERDFFDKPEMLGEPIATLRLLHYEGGNQIEGHWILSSNLHHWKLYITHILVGFSLFPLGQISNPLKGIYGAGAHSDYGLITLLATDDVLGLQVWILLKIFKLCYNCISHNFEKEWKLFNSLQICKDKDARPQTWEYVAPLKGWVIGESIGYLELENRLTCIWSRTIQNLCVRVQTCVYSRTTPNNLYAHPPPDSFPPICVFVCVFILGLHILICFILEFKAQS